MNRGKEKKGNRGFTLVEVLIATAILGIMVGPVLSSFVSVARVNVSSRKRLSATTVGESIAEAVKAYSLGDFAKQCDYPAQGFSLLAGDLQSTDISFKGNAFELKEDATDVCADADKVVQEDVSTGDYVFTSGRNKYVFMITDIPMGGTNYDAIITYNYVGKDQKDEKIGSELVEDLLGEYSIRALNYYSVEIEVYKSATGNVPKDRIATYTKPLARIAGTKADYN